MRYRICWKYKGMSMVYFGDWSEVPVKDMADRLNKRFRHTFNWQEAE